MPNDTETATFAAGCFWGVERAFRKIDGVLDAQVGYTGGTARNPTYHNVCTGLTGHAEAVRVTYDPQKVGYDKLVAAFFAMHNPTQVDGQGVDIGTQYRSAVFYHSEEQRDTAEMMKEALDASGRLRKPITTEITAASDWWPAEEYHQRYLEKQGRY